MTSYPRYYFLGFKRALSSFPLADSAAWIVFKFHIWPTVVWCCMMKKQTIFKTLWCIQKSALTNKNYESNAIMEEQFVPFLQLQGVLECVNSKFLKCSLLQSAT